MPSRLFFVGTSGWQYKHWVGSFYPENSKVRDQWACYTKQFDTVEINNSFYKLPSFAVFESWCQTSPEEMVFAVKANRFLTHMKKLNHAQEPVGRLFASISGLKTKLGPILFQLPPKWKINSGRLSDFLQILPAGFQYVFEFRNDTWYCEDVYQLLRKHNCAFCIYELAGHRSPMIITADFIYVRLHGPTEIKYQGSYSHQALAKWASRMKRWMATGMKVYVYFDNDEKGFAPANALALKRLLFGHSRRP